MRQVGSGLPHLPVAQGAGRISHPPLLPRGADLGLQTPERPLTRPSLYGLVPTPPTAAISQESADAQAQGARSAPPGRCPEGSRRPHFRPPNPSIRAATGPGVEDLRTRFGRHCQGERPPSPLTARAAPGRLRRAYLLRLPRTARRGGGASGVSTNQSRSGAARARVLDTCHAASDVCSSEE